MFEQLQYIYEEHADSSYCRKLSDSGSVYFLTKKQTQLSY